MRGRRRRVLRGGAGRRTSGRQQRKVVELKRGVGRREWFPRWKEEAQKGHASEVFMRKAENGRSNAKEPAWEFFLSISRRRAKTSVRSAWLRALAFCFNRLWRREAFRKSRESFFFSSRRLFFLRFNSSIFFSKRMDTGGAVLGLAVGVFFRWVRVAIVVGEIGVVELLEELLLDVVGRLLAAFFRH